MDANKVRDRAASAPASNPSVVLEDGPVEFYLASEKPYGAFSNLSYHTVEMDGVVYPTAEHAYQAGKVRDSRVLAWLMSAPTAGLLAHTAHAVLGERKYLEQYCRPDWKEIKVGRMQRVVGLKFLQHNDLGDLLLSTGDREIVEVGFIDDEAGRFWGRVNGVGQNTLGHILMYVRANLRKEGGRFNG